METESNSFDGTTFKGHNLKYNWTISLPLHTIPIHPSYDGFSSVTSTSRRLLCDNKYSSSEFSMSKMCCVKFKMMCQKMTCNDTYNFKIGLKREDSNQRAVNTFCFIKINFSHSGESKENSFQFNFTGKGNEYYSEEIRLKRTIPGGASLFRGYNLPTNVKLHITGIVVAQNCCETQREEKEPMENNISQLQQDFKTVFKRKEIADVSLIVRNERLATHKFVLTARSPVFRRMFSQGLTERQQNSVQIDDFEKSVMEVFLLFLYTGALEDREFSTVFELYSVADKYEVTTLFETCRDILISHVTLHTVIPVLKLADMHSDDEMKDFAIKYICENFSKVETTAEWEELLDSNPRLASYSLRRVSRNISK